MKSSSANLCNAFMNTSSVVIITRSQQKKASNTNQHNKVAQIRLDYMQRRAKRASKTYQSHFISQSMPQHVSLFIIVIMRCTYRRQTVIVESSFSSSICLQDILESMPANVSHYFKKHFMHMSSSPMSLFIIVIMRCTCLRKSVIVEASFSSSICLQDILQSLPASASHCFKKHFIYMRSSS